MTRTALFAVEKRLTARKEVSVGIESIGGKVDMITNEQFEWMTIVGGMQHDGLSWVEAMGLCRSTMEMPDSVYSWLLERKKKEQVTTSFKNSEAF